MAKAYLYSLTDTWDNAATTFNAIRMSVTDTASAAGSLLFDLQRNATTAFSVAKTGVVKIVETASGRDLQIQGSTTGAFHRLFSSNTSAGFSFENNAVVLGTLSATTGLGIGSGGDLFLNRDAANTLAQRNGTSAQTFRLYNTYTDASNYERLAFLVSGGSFIIQTERAGTGTARALYFGANGTQSWFINTSNHFLAGADNTYDIGASGANRPRALYLSSGVFAPYLQTTSGAGAVRAFWYSAVSDVMSLGKSTGVGGSLELTEDTAPAAPATNSVRIYAEDNGAGKTRIMARFATGAAVQIAIEP